MNTTGAAVPFRSDRAVLRTAFVVDAVLWLATAGVSRLRYLYADGEDWELPYAVFSIVLLIAAAATTLTVVRYTSKLNGHRAPRIAAIVLALVGVASTIMAWAFPLWAVLLAAGFAALAATGSRHARGALWLSAGLLVGLAVAIVGLTAKLGPPGDYNDYSQAQGWGVTVAGALTAIVLAVLARRTSQAHTDALPATL